MMAQCSGCHNTSEARQIKELQHRIHLLELKGFLENEIPLDRGCDNCLSRKLDCVNFLLETVGAKA